MCVLHGSWCAGLLLEMKNYCSLQLMFDFRCSQHLKNIPTCVFRDCYSFGFDLMCLRPREGPLMGVHLSLIFFLLYQLASCNVRCIMVWFIYTLVMQYHCCHCVIMLVSRNLFSLFNFSPHVRVRVTMFPHSIAQHHYTDILKKKKERIPMWLYTRCCSSWQDDGLQNHSWCVCLR